VSLKQFALQEALYARLNNDSTLTNTYGASVYDEVPEGSSYPYVVLGEVTAIDYGTKDTDGSENTLTFHVWSQYRGAKEAKNIMDRMHDLLHDYSLSVTGANLINLRFEFGDLLRDPDGITRHGVMRFRAIILGG
jgi:hypothetical protein|tara:strand:+ start:941 stop:1345 length:405 start_codon:yes stop_codon:yes gene_type:complete